MLAGTGFAPSFPRGGQAPLEEKLIFSMSNFSNELITISEANSRTTYLWQYETKLPHSFLTTKNNKHIVAITKLFSIKI